MLLLVREHGTTSGADVDIKKSPVLCERGKKVKNPSQGGGYIVALAEAEAPLIRCSYLRNSGRMPRSA
jgi:hypothetical protein